jgi:basic membrane protein A
MNLLTLFLIVLLTGCSTSQEDTLPGRFKVVMVLDTAGLGDKGFNDAGWAGVQKAVDELGVEAAYLMSNEQADYVSNLTLAAQQADAVVAMGFLMIDAVGQVARAHPETKFIFVDGEVTGDNVASFDFKAQEGAFLAGIIAAMTTHTGKVGCVLGMDIPPVRAYEVGYRAGIKVVNEWENKSVTYLSATIGDFNNPSRGKALAQGLIGQGCDIVMQLAGNSGLGVIEAVKEAEGRVFAIGADLDQDDLAPGRVLVSVLKRIDVAVFGAIREAKSGDFKSGHRLIGIAQGGMGLTEMKYTRDVIPEKAFEMVGAAEERMRGGGTIDFSRLRVDYLR